MAETNVKNISNDFIFVWLDKSIEESRENRDTKALIRQTVRGRLLTYDNADYCIDHIITELTTRSVFLIVSNFFGQNVVPLIYPLPNIHTIYVYCGNRKGAEQWVKPNFKVAGIFTEKKSLINQIRDDIGACDHDRDLPISVFHIEERENSLRDLTKESATFMWYQLLIIVLRSMRKLGNSKTEMINECRANYTDEAEKKKIDNFEQTYEVSKAIWWYTFDSFLYRLLNKALRTQVIKIIFKFRFFINDLHNQIERLYLQFLHTHSAEHRLTVYRGQRLSIAELDTLKHNVNGLISMNSFLSATSLRELAIIFADTSDQCNEPSPLQSVLFIINVCDMNKETTPFAFIRDHSCCQDEEEVLFTMGAIFKVQSVEKNENTWHVHLQLSKQQNKFSQEFQHHMMKQIGSEPSPLALGWFLFRMSEFNEAERYAHLLLEQLPSNDKEVPNIYNLLGLIYKDTKRAQEAVKCYETALSISSSTRQPNSPNVIATHYNLALAYLVLGNDQRADELLKNAKGKLMNSCQPNNPFLIAMTDSLQAKIQTVYGDYSSAFKSLEEVLRIKTMSLPPAHPSIASTLNDMGVVQEKMSNDQKAFDYFTQALEVCRHSLSSNNLDLSEYHANIGRIRYKREEYELALVQFELAFNIATNDVRDFTDEMLTLEKNISETKKRLK